ncbi:head-tail connector protein [Acinetobacter sp. ANC 4631]
MSDYNITLEKMKHYLSILHDRDDSFIQSLIQVALADVQNAIDRSFDEVDSLGKKILVDANGNIPAPLEAAVKMVIDDLYHNRSAQFDQQQFDNKTFTRLFMPYRKMGV